MTYYTALVIQNQDNDIHCEPYLMHRHPTKHAGAINLYHDGSFHTTLLSSEPVFESSRAAVEAMENVVQQIRDADVPT